MLFVTYVERKEGTFRKHGTQRIFGKWRLSCCLRLMWNEKKGHLENVVHNAASKAKIFMLFVSYVQWKEGTFKGHGKQHSFFGKRRLPCCLCLMWNEKQGYLENMESSTSKAKIVMLFVFYVEWKERTFRERGTQRIESRDCHAVCVLCKMKIRDIWRKWKTSHWKGRVSC